jgi:hypothetical protein
LNGRRRRRRRRRRRKEGGGKNEMTVDGVSWEKNQIDLTPR